MRSMLFKHPGSRARYREYIKRRKDPNWAKMDKESVRAAEAGRRSEAAAGGGIAPPRARSRTFGTLLVEFWRQIEGSHAVLFLALGTLSVSTIIGLVVPASTKVAIDYVLTDHPGPSALPGAVLRAVGVEGDITGADRKRLLWGLGAVMIAVSAASVTVGSWGRWQTTRLTKRTQAAMRARPSSSECCLRSPKTRRTASCAE
jgi:ATP-binding cassette subfamily B protein/subfamily B ATP-binding cassette protein MsbA